MKNILIPIIVILFVSLNWSYSQSYSTAIENNNVTISIDLSTFEDALIVTREIEESPSGVIINSSDLQLVGEFDIDSNGDIVFDYTQKLYYIIPFINSPIINMNDAIPNNIESGIFTVNSALGGGGGDGGWFNCQCGSWAPDPDTGPGGCVSNLTNGRVRCVNDNGCTSGCQSSITPGVIGNPIEGGGVLVSVSKDRGELFYRI